MDGDLLTMLDHDRTLMIHALSEAKERGLALAHAEAEYQTAKNKTALLLKAEGQAATMISLLLKGDERVSNALFMRDCAQVMYDSAKEAINTYKLSARLIEAQIAREYNQGDYV